MKPPPKMTMKMESNSNNIERRYFPGHIETRMDSETKTERFAGIASTTGQEYTLYEDDREMFVEVIAPGAFRDAGKHDIRVLKNHDPNFLLARTASGTAKVTETPEGLAYEWQNDPTMTYAADLAASIRRGDTNQSSFGFIIGKDNDKWERSTRADGKTVHKRTILGFRDIFDVSPVTFPANPTTTVQKRDLESALKAWEERNTEKPADRPIENDAPETDLYKFRLRIMEMEASI